MSKATIPNPALEPFEFLVGRWKTHGAHPHLPGTAIRGEVSFEWFEGGSFLMMRSVTEPSLIPAAIAIFGSDDATNEYFMLYVDDRGVSRKYDVSVSSGVLRWARHTPEFSQRFTITVVAGERKMIGAGEMSKGDGAWEPDLRLEYELWATP